MSHLVEVLRGRVHEPEVDPPEQWERPLAAGAAGRRGAAGAEHPHVPLRWQDVPAGAAQALQAACGAWRLDQLFVVPPSARRLVGWRDRWVATPAQVLGLADRGAALWISTQPDRGVVTAIALEELAAIDHVQILLYARLTFLAPGRRLTLRYNAVARHALEDELAAVRAAAAGYPLPVPSDEPPPALAHKWAHLVRSPAICLAPGDATIARTGELPAVRGEPPTTVLLVLTPRELIVARDPDATVLGGASPYGHDILAVPRRQLGGVERTDSGARLRAGGVNVDVDLSPSRTDELIALAELGRAP
jgi:hypothetical protein